MLSPAGDLTFVFSEFRLERFPAVVAAVSGGSDSTALLLLVKAYLDRAASGTRLLAVTVDHRLRPESAREADTVRRLAASLRINHQTLSWDDPKPETGIIAAAREARYDLLKQAAQNVGATIILTAHTADDQAETVFMRKQRGAGPGLSGMAPATLFDGTHWVVRPLLGQRRATLREYLSANGVGWFDDPTNSNVKYERARIRSELGTTPSAIAALLALAARSGKERITLAASAAALLSSQARQPAPGLFHVDPDFVHPGNSAAAVHALRHLLGVVGGVEHLPDRDRVATLIARANSASYRTTLSRCVIACRRDGIWLCREQRALPLPALLRNEMVWDRRFRISPEPNSRPEVIVPFGPDNAKDCEIDSRVPRGLARAALASRPAVQSSEKAVQIDAPTPILAPFSRFLPSFDLALANALSELVGAPAPAAPPWAGHIVTRA